MALGTQFQSTGAIPKYSAEGLKRVQGLGLTVTPTATNNQRTAALTGLPNINQGTNKGMIEPPKATTPLKKTTTTNADGTSTTHEYHAETTPSIKGTTTTTPSATPVTSSTTTPVPAYTPPPTTSTNPAIQAGYVGQIGQQTVNEAQTQGRLIEQSTTTGPEYQKVNDDLAKIRENIRISKENYAKARTDLYSEPGSITLKEGREKLLAQQYGMEQTAMSEQANALADQLSAANTQQGLQTTAAQGAYTGAQTQAQRNLGAQGQVLSAGLYQPAAIGQVPYSSLTGQSQGMLGGTEGYATLGKLEAQKATAGQQYQQTEQYKSAHQQAQNLQAQLGDLITTFGLNPSDINLANAGIQKIAANVSDPKYKILSNYLADVASRYSQILTPAGGSSTDTTRAVATGMLDGIASGKSIIEVMNALDQQAQAVIAGVTTSNTGTPSGSQTGGNMFGSFFGQ